MKSTSFDANFNVFRFYLLDFGVDDVNFNHFSLFPLPTSGIQFKTPIILLIVFKRLISFIRRCRSNNEICFLHPLFYQESYH